MEDFDYLFDAFNDGFIECECCGERVELDGVCPEGTPSPVLGLI
jgi:hypothetical protein